MPSGIHVGDKYTMNQKPYDYEWMNAAQETAGLLEELFPVVQQYGDLFGLLPKDQPTQPQTVVVQPKPWYEDLPPWVWGVAAAVGALVLFRVLED